MFENPIELNSVASRLFALTSRDRDIALHAGFTLREEGGKDFVLPTLSTQKAIVPKLNSERV